MFVRICPYLPFSARVCLNQHHWLANRMGEEGIAFKQCANAFMGCAKPERLQQLADSLTPWDLLSCGQKWPRNSTRECSPCSAAPPNATPLARCATTLQNSGPKGSSPSFPTPVVIDCFRRDTRSALS